MKYSFVGLDLIDYNLPSISSHMTVTTRFRQFVGFALSGFLVNLLLMTDLYQFLDRVEVPILQAVQNPEGLQSFTYYWQKAFYYWLPFNEFWMRSASMVVGLVILFVWWAKGRPLFGLGVQLIHLVMITAGWGFVYLSKLLNGDIVLILWQSLFALSLLTWMKRQNRTDFAFMVVSMIFGVWTHPVSMALFGAVLVTALQLFKLLDNQQHRSVWFVFIPSLVAGFLVSSQLSPIPDEFFFIGFKSLGILDYLIYLGFSVIPFVAFLPSAIWEMIQKVRKGEELSKIFASLLLASIICQSAFVFIILTLMMARQMLRYFFPNYPYQSIVKGTAVLTMISFFITAVAAMMTGVGGLQGSGFAAMATLFGSTWICCFIAVIGLYSFRKPMVFGGFVGMGILFTLLLNVRVGPYLEQQRNLPKRLVEAAQPYLKDRLPYGQGTIAQMPVTQVYFAGQGSPLNLISDPAEIRSKAQAQEIGVYFFEQEQIQSSFPEAKKMEGKTAINGLEHQIWLDWWPK